MSRVQDLVKHAKLRGAELALGALIMAVGVSVTLVVGAIAPGYQPYMEIVRLIVLFSMALITYVIWTRPPWREARRARRARAEVRIREMRARHDHPSQLVQNEALIARARGPLSTLWHTLPLRYGALGFVAMCAGLLGMEGVHLLVTRLPRDLHDMGMGAFLIGAALMLLVIMYGLLRAYGTWSSHGESRVLLQDIQTLMGENFEGAAGGQLSVTASHVEGALTEHEGSPT